MEETYDLLARRLLDTVEAVGSSAKYLIGLAGPPGAGKSTVAQQVVARLNHIWNAERACLKETEEIAVAVPMDGFHLYRWQLDKMEKYAGLKVDLHGRILLKPMQDEEVRSYAMGYFLSSFGKCGKGWGSYRQPQSSIFQERNKK